MRFPLRWRRIKGLTFIIPLRRYQLKYDWLHRRHITKSNFRNVESTHNVRPSLVISFLECTIPWWTQLTSNSRWSLLRFTFTTVPGLQIINQLRKGESINQRPIVLLQSAPSQFRSMPGEQQQYNFDHHNRRGDFQASPFRQNIRNTHRPSPSFWPAIIVDFFAIAHAKFARCKRQIKKGWKFLFGCGCICEGGWLRMCRTMQSEIFSLLAMIRCTPIIVYKLLVFARISKWRFLTYFSSSSQKNSSLIFTFNASFIGGSYWLLAFFLSFRSSFNCFPPHTTRLRSSVSSLPEKKVLFSVSSMKLHFSDWINALEELTCTLFLVFDWGFCCLINNFPIWDWILRDYFGCQLVH